MTDAAEMPGHTLQRRLDWASLWASPGPGRGGMGLLEAMTAQPGSVVGLGRQRWARSGVGEECSTRQEVPETEEQQHPAEELQA